jgi:DNA polymerase-4
MAERCVAHLDMDAFYVSVELRRRPELEGLPVIVAGSGPRAVVTTASYEARRFGVGSAMPAARARRLCPDAVVLTPDFAYYREVSTRVMSVVRRHVEQVEVVGLDEAYMELSALPAQPDDSRAAQSGEPGWRAGGQREAAVRLIRAEIERDTGLGCSVGIGPSKLVAKVASDAEKPRGFVVLSREQACQRFHSSPCGLVPGIGPKTVERLQGCGIATLGALAGATQASLAGVFGARMAGELQRRARFEDESPVTQDRKVISESRETTFDRDISELAELELILEQLARRLCETLTAQGRRGRTIAIKIRLDDFSTHTRARTLPAPVAAAEHVSPVAVDLLRRFGPARPVRLLGVRVAGLEHGEGRPVQQLTLSM